MENRNYPQSKMSNLILIRLSRSIVLAAFPRRLCRQSSGSWRRPLITSTAYLGSRFSAAWGGGSNLYSQKIAEL